MTLKELARKLRPYIEKAAISLSDEDALQAIQLYPEWSGDGIAYKVDQRIRYEGTLYKVVLAHTSQEGWTPTTSPSLFAKVLIPDANVIPEWQQPDSTNPYQIGDRVTHNGKTWENTVANNVWEPGVYGWTQVS